MTHIRFLTVLTQTLVVFFSFCLSSQAASPLVDLDRVEGDTLYFKSEDKSQTIKPLKTGLSNLSYRSVLRPKEGLPYFVFTGKPCENCGGEQAVYLIRPTATERPHSFVYPGRITDPKSGSLLLESRAFYGKCLSRFGDAYVVFQKEKIDRKPRLQSSVFVAEAGKEHLIETLIERRMPQLRTTLQYVKRKTCREIEGTKRLMLRKPLDLNPKNMNDNEDEDDNRDDNDSEREGLKDSLLQTTSSSGPAPGAAHIPLSSN